MTQLRSKNKLLLKVAASSAKKDGLVTEVFLRQVESRPRLVSQVHHLTHQVTSLSLSYHHHQRITLQHYSQHHCDYPEPSSTF